jgi:DNA-binding CsgD family transcriptional regulator
VLVKSLAQRDVSALLDFLRWNYVPRDLREFRSHIFVSLPRLVPSEVTGYNEVDLRRQHNEFILEPDEALHFPDSAQIFNQHIREHPLISYHSQTKDDRVVKISDFLTRTQFRRLGLYQDFFRPMGIEDQIAVVLAMRKSVLLGVALNRSRPGYTERERLLLTLIRPHLIQAYENAVAWSAMKQRLDLADRGLDRMRAAVVTLLASGSIDSIPSSAQKLLGKYFGARPRSQGLPNLLRTWIKHQRSLLAQIQVPRPLVVNHQGERLIVRMISENDHIFLLLREQITSIRHQAMLADGLTPREAEVLAWAARGRTNSEIANILTISARTVQKHLERIFQKLGVESRTAAAAHVWEATQGGSDGNF